LRRRGTCARYSDTVGSPANQNRQGTSAAWATPTRGPATIFLGFSAGPMLPGRSRSGELATHTSAPSSDLSMSSAWHSRAGPHRTASKIATATRKDARLFIRYRDNATAYYSQQERPVKPGARNCAACDKETGHALAALWHFSARNPLQGLDRRYQRFKYISSTDCGIRLRSCALFALSIIFTASVHLWTGGNLEKRSI